jgi:hypothetical protein
MQVAVVVETMLETLALLGQVVLEAEVLVEMVMELQEVLTLVAVEEAVASLVDLPLVVQAVVV